PYLWTLARQSEIPSSIYWSFLKEKLHEGLLAGGKVGTGTRACCRHSARAMRPAERKPGQTAALNVSWDIESAPSSGSGFAWGGSATMAGSAPFAALSACLAGAGGASCAARINFSCTETPWPLRP